MAGQGFDGGEKFIMGRSPTRENPDEPWQLISSHNVGPGIMSHNSEYQITMTMKYQDSQWWILTHEGGNPAKLGNFFSMSIAYISPPIHGQKLYNKEKHLKCV